MSLEGANEWELCVSVKCERVKEEPGLEQRSWSSACAAEDEAGGQTECGVSAAAARAGLYAAHEVKGELVLGPTALQPPDSAFAPAVSVNNEETTTNYAINACSRRPIQGPLPGASPGWHRLRGCFVRLERLLVKEQPNRQSLSMTPPQAQTVALKNADHTASLPAEDSSPCLTGGTRSGTGRGQPQPTQVHSRRKQQKIGQKLYKCEHCMEWFSDKCSLVSHERVHRVEEQYECDMCGEQLWCKWRLVEHVLGHSGPRAACPPCALCGARFERWEHLRRHAARHIWAPEHPGGVGRAPEPAGARLRACSVLVSRLPALGRADSAALGASAPRETSRGADPAAARASELYACDACGEQFARRRALVRHIPLHTSDLRARAATPTGTAPNVVSDESRSGPTALSTASATRNQSAPLPRTPPGARDTPLKWKLSNKRFSSNGQLVNHGQTHTGKYKCEICLKLFTKRYALVRHEQIHTGEKPHKCKLCLKQFSEKNHLESHVRIHTGKKPYECNICMKRFARSGDLTVHKRIHTGEKPYECNICLKRFTQSSTLNFHKRSHIGEKPYQCNICLKRFKHSRSLVIHKRIHTGERPYECNICLKHFTHGSYLPVHKKIHTGEKPYECNICLKRFIHSSALTAHKSIHKGVKPYECNICLKHFTHGSALTAHKSIHTGVKPYECNICLKHFTLSRYLAIHKRIHTAEKPYECKICLKQFTQKVNLIAHVRIHNGK